MSANRFTRDSQKGPLDIMNWASSNQNQPQTYLHARNDSKGIDADFTENPCKSLLTDFMLHLEKYRVEGDKNVHIQELEI